MSKLELAPTVCPECGAEKEWVCTGDPCGKNTSRGESASWGFGKLGVTGAVLGALFPNDSRVTYYCMNCGFKEEYKAD